MQAFKLSEIKATKLKIDKKPPKERFNQAYLPVHRIFPGFIALNCPNCALGIPLNH